jgi:hypothetical protein
MESLHRGLDPVAREIKLFELLSAQHPNGTIKCTLRSVSLTSKPSYLALSYVWGDATDKRSINANGIPFLFTATLFAALKRMRSNSGSEHSTY